MGRTVEVLVVTIVTVVTVLKYERRVWLSLSSESKTDCFIHFLFYIRYIHL